MQAVNAAAENTIRENQVILILNIRLLLYLMLLSSNHKPLLIMWKECLGQRWRHLKS
jgi:hypothetical protein